MAGPRSPREMRKAIARNLPAKTGRTFDVSQVVGRKWDVATTVHAGLPVIAERAMYGDAAASVAPASGR